jgi:RNA polymerase sigma-70 factor (ECF subfamily)
MTSQGETAHLVDRLRAGDPTAAARLIEHTRERLRVRARHMLRGFGGIRRWEETDDVLQNALVKLNRALTKLRPNSTRHYYNLATVQLRRVLLDLADHYQGPLGLGANHHTDPTGGQVARRADSSTGPGTIAERAEVHRAVERLPDALREVVDLLWYQGLTQKEAAAVLGMSERNLKRLWRAAKLKLADLLGGAADGR